MFYVVSAFTLYLSMRSRSRKERNPLGNFFIRRFFRIAPMFYLAILANVAYVGYQNMSETATASYPSATDLFLGFTFLLGLSPQAINSVAIGGWSVADE